MTTPYAMIRDINGTNGFGLTFSNSNFSATLAATTDTTLTVPTDNAPGITSGAVAHKFLAVISYTDAKEVWVAVNATAAVPAGVTFAATTSIRNPSGRLVKSGDVLHFFATTSGTSVSVVFYAVI